MTLARIASTSDSNWTWLTSSRQRIGRGIGHSLRMDRDCASPLSIRHSPRATEFPVLRSFAKFGPDGIPFDGAQNRIKRIVFFDGKRLKSTVVKMPGPFRVVVSMPTHDMGVCRPSKEVRERIVIRWANHKMPVVAHQTVAQKWQRKLGVSFDEYPFKRLVVLKFFEQRQPCPFSFMCHGSVEHVKTSSARTYTGATRHTGRIKTFSREVNLMSCVPFSFSCENSVSLFSLLIVYKNTNPFRSPAKFFWGLLFIWIRVIALKM